MKKTIKAALLCGSILTLGLTSANITKTYAQDETVSVSDMSQEDLGDFVRSYILNNPEIIFEAVERHNQQQELERTANVQKKLMEHKETLYGETKTVAGNPDADITIVEFFDYNCGYCKRALDDVQKILDNDDNVRVVFKELPILSPASVKASQYAQAAAEQGSDLYFKYHVALMEHRGGKDEDSLLRIAKDVGLDIEKLKDDAQKDEVREKLQKNKEISQDLGIRGTPAFIIEEFISPGYMGYDNMKDVIKTARDTKAVKEEDAQ